MTTLLDTEGKPIPPDCDGGPMFDADLCDRDDGNGPMLVINVPVYFETSHGTYDSEGVVHAPLKDVLEEYLRDFAGEDGGLGIDAFAAWLHEYADRLKAANRRGKTGSRDVSHGRPEVCLMDCRKRMTPDATNHDPRPEYLRALIDRAGLSHRAAARQIGISERAIRQYLKGTRRIKGRGDVPCLAPYPVQFALECLAEREAS